MTRLDLVLLSCLALTLTACAGSNRVVMHQRTDGFQEEDTLRIALDRSPSGGAQLNFCADPAVDAPVNLTNAAWLSFFAANEYSHLHYWAESLAKLGFRNDDRLGLDWARCAIDLRMLRGFEQKHKVKLRQAHGVGPQRLVDYVRPYAQLSHPQSWGRCASDWFHHSRYDGQQYPAAAFEHFLIKTVHPGHRLQFFSGGKFVLEGKAYTEGSTQVVVARHRALPLVIVAFRGTEPDKFGDLIVDGKAWKTSLSRYGWAEAWGSIHKGFHGAYASVREVLQAKLEETRGQDVQLWITGHSLGGALATVLAADLLRQKEDGKDVHLRGLYTYGSPRVGNAAFQRQFEQAANTHGVQVVRFRNGDDMVTRIPGLVLEYRHVGTLAHLTDAGLAFPDEEPSYAGLGSIGDHDITGWDANGKPVSGYYRRLREVFRSTPADSPKRRCTNGS